jgi:hypothetical protein
VIGSDSNDGQSVGSPVQTVMGGIVQRWGTIAPLLAQTTTIHLLTSETLNQEAVVLNPVLVDGVDFVIVGTLLAVGGTFTGVTVNPMVPTAAGHNLQFATTPPGAAVGQLVYNETKLSYATVHSIHGGGIVSLTQPIGAAGLTTVTSFPLLGADDTWATSDDYQLYQAPMLNLQVLNCWGGAADPAADAPVCWIQNIYVPDSSGTPGNSIFAPVVQGPSFVFTNSRVDAYFLGNANLVSSVGNVQNTLLFAGMNLGTFCSMFGGAANTSLAVSSAFSGGSADFNAVLDGTTEISAPGGYFGNVSARGNVIVSGGGVLKITPYRQGGANLWGPATLELIEANSSVDNPTTFGTFLWTTILNMAALTINGATTGTAFSDATNTWLSGISLTSANIDAPPGATNPGLINPRTGCGFKST